MICLTFDIEERFHAHLSPQDAPRHWKLRDRINQLLDLLQKYKRKATFFVVGDLAKKYPDVIKRMSELGYEVASHSHRHEHFARMSPQSCKEDITQSKETLENIIGKRVFGFRAPSWSASLEDDWLWEHLIHLGFCYDSSLFPFKTHLYGSLKNPLEPFELRSQLMEVPPSVFQLGPFRIPFGGGFYFRFLPFWLTKHFLRSHAKNKKPAVVYLHPWEFDKDEVTLEKGWMNKFIAHHNINTNWSRFENLLLNFETTTIMDFLKKQK